MTLHAKAVAPKDFRGEIYPDRKVGNISLLTKAFMDEVQFQWVRSPEELLAALKYGEYLKSQGYGEVVEWSVDHLGLKMLWWGKSNNPTTRRTFGVLVDGNLLPIDAHGAAFNGDPFPVVGEFLQELVHGKAN